MWGQHTRVDNPSCEFLVSRTYGTFANSCDAHPSIHLLLREDQDRKRGGDWFYSFGCVLISRNSNPVQICQGGFNFFLLNFKS